MKANRILLYTFLGLLVPAIAQPLWACPTSSSTSATDEKEKARETDKRRDIDPNATAGARGTRAATLTGTLVVRVLADEAPVEGAKVCVMRGDDLLAEETTDERGLARVPALPEGRYELTVSKKGLRTRTKDVAVAAGEMEVELVMERAPSWFWRFWRRESGYSGRLM